MHRPYGFSLIELLAVMAIAAILAALAVQSYSRYLFRLRRADAQQTLMAIAQAQERWYATHHRYAQDLNKLGYAGSAVSMHGYYALMLSTADDGYGYVAAAVPIDRQAGDACGSLSIDDAGRKRPDKDNDEANANGPCW